MLKVDGVMGKADSLMLGLNTIAGGKAGGELYLTVKSIRELAEDFDKRSGALMADGRRTLADISRAVNNFDRNPTPAAVRRRQQAARRASGGPAPPPAAEAPTPRQVARSAAVGADRRQSGRRSASSPGPRLREAGIRRRLRSWQRLHAPQFGRHFAKSTRPLWRMWSGEADERVRRKSAMQATIALRQSPRS